MLKQCKDAYYTLHSNGNHFAVIYDHYSGRNNRYTVLVWRNGKTAKILGLELPLDEAERIISAYPPKRASYRTMGIDAR